MAAWLPPLRSPDRAVQVQLKLENLQRAGGLETRGVLNAVLNRPDGSLGEGIVTTWWGSVGPSAAYVGQLLGLNTIVYLTEVIASPERAAAAEQWGATVAVQGGTWDATEQLAARYAASHDMTYVHPYADPLLIEGNGTVALELLDTAPSITTLVVPASAGGGVISGVALAAKEACPGIRIVGVEHEQGPRLYRSLRHGRPTSLPADLQPYGPRRPASLNYALVRQYVDEIVLVTAKEAQETLRILWHELEVSADRHGVISIAASLAGKVATPSQGTICAIIGASGEDGLF